MRIMNRVSGALLAAGLGLTTLMAAPAAQAAGGGEVTECTPKKQSHHERHCSFQGVFGHFDHDSALRGFEVYRNVCAGCHSLDLFAFRNLSALGATEAEIKGVAALYEVPAIPNDEGEVLMRPALPADNYPAPFPNEKAAAYANGGAIPPDLSLIVKARPGFEDHLANILTGYSDPPEGCDIPEGKYYNAYFPGYAFGMPPPLSEGAVEYNDGTEATVEQMTHDVTQFLAFVAEPKLEERKQFGVKAVIFLIILTVLLYFTKKQVWRKVH